MSDSERVRVVTYVPQRQKAEWADHAEALDMSQAEFLRTMVQAGRRGFEVDGSSPASEDGEGGGSSDADPGGHGLEVRVLAVLREHDHCSWEELVEHVSDDIESRLDDALESLQTANRVAYSGRAGGYRLVDDE